MIASNSCHLAMQLVIALTLIGGGGTGSSMFDVSMLTAALLVLAVAFVGVEAYLFWFLS